MTDEDTKEHPVYPVAPPPGEPVQGELVPPAPAQPVAMPAGPLPAQPPPVAPVAVDPLEPTTTISTTPITPPGMAPIAPGMSPPAPAYPQPPNQGWTGQPPQGPPNFPSPQGQWQQPGYGAPGYGAPGYGQPGYGYAPSQQWAATAPTYRTSVLVALAGLVLIVFGVALAVLGAWTLTLGSDLGRFIRDNDIAIFGRQIDRETLRAVIQPMPGVLMVLGVLQLLVGAVILAHRNWARWLGVLLALLGLIVSVISLSAVLALVPGMSVQLIVASVLVVSYAVVLLALIAGGGHFRAQHPPAR